MRNKVSTTRKRARKEPDTGGLPEHKQVVFSAHNRLYRKLLPVCLIH